MHLTLLSFRSLTKRKVRTTLCLLGIALGVMVILSVGNVTMTYTAALREMSTFFQGEVAVVPRGSFFIQALPLGGFLPEAIVDEVEEVEGVEEAVPMLVVIKLPLGGDGGGVELSPLVPMNISFGIAEGGWEILVGSTPLKAEKMLGPNLGENEMIIGRYLAERNNLTVGSEIKIRGHLFEVVGVLDTYSGFLTRLIIIPLDVAQRIYGYYQLINMIVVKPMEGLSEEELADKIEFEVQGVRALTTDDRGELAEPLFRDIELWNMGLRTALYLVSMVLVATVTTINISERRKEIATLDAIGAPKRFILRMVVTEGALLGLLGGLVGAFLGSIVSMLLLSRYVSVPVTMIFSNPLSIIQPIATLEVFLSTVIISITASVPPTLLALRSNIIDSLRSEH